MKKYQILLLKIFNWLLLIFLFFLSLKWTLSFIRPKVEFEKELKKVEEYLPLKEIKEKVGEIKGKVVQNLPEESLKINLKVESKKVSPFSVDLATKENEIFFKVPFGWQKIEIGKESFDDLKRLVEILKGKQIFKEFNKKNNEVEFLIDKEKLKEAIFEWKDEEKLKEGLSELSDVGGKIFYNEKGEIEKIEIETEGGKLEIKFLNLKEKTEKENLENLILSLIK